MNRWIRPSIILTLASFFFIFPMFSNSIIRAQAIESNSAKQLFYGNKDEHATVIVTPTDQQPISVELHAPDTDEVLATSSTTGDQIRLDVPLPLRGIYAIVIGPEQENIPPYTIEVDINEKQVYVAPPPNNCTISINGQGWHVSGGSGGLAAAPEGDVADVSAVVANILENLRVAPSTPPPATPVPLIGSGPVAILIVDEFSQGVDPSDSVNNILVNMAGGTPLAVPHGNLVFTHLNNLLSNMPGFTEGDSDEDSTNWDWNGATVLKIYKVRVDPLYSTQVIADKTSEAVIALKRSSSIFRFVINMSFSILPCDSTTELRNFIQGNSASLTPLRDYYESLPDHSDTGDPTIDVPAFQKWIQDTLMRNVGFDPMQALYFNMTNGSDGSPVYTQNTVFVASAGNEADLGFPLYPAAWSTVIGVSAYEGDPNAQLPWKYSNVSDVILPGAWFEYKGLYYAGTSFAAPIMSLISALRLTVDSRECPFDLIPPDIATSNNPDLQSIKPFKDLIAHCPS